MNRQVALFLVLIFFGIPAGLKAEDEANKAKPAKKVLEERLKEISVPGTINCGHWTRETSWRKRQESMACAKKAAGEKKPFRLSFTAIGPNLKAEIGIISQNKNMAFWFTHIPDPCSDCSDLFIYGECGELYFEEEKVGCPEPDRPPREGL